MVEFSPPGNLVVGDSGSLSIGSDTALFVSGCVDTSNGTLIVTVASGTATHTDGDYTAVPTAVNTTGCINIGKLQLDGIRKQSCEKVQTKTDVYGHTPP